MKTFKEYLAEVSIRTGLPHITTMDHSQFHGLIKNGKIHFHDLTEKTDGQNVKMGHDEHGFYTQSTGSGSDKMRAPEDYEKRAKARAEATGKPYSDVASKAFGHIHATLQANKKLTDHLKSEYEKSGKDVAVHGESFYKPWGRPSETKPGEVKFVGTSYDPSHMGKVGKFVIHSKLPINADHNLEHFKKKLSDTNINYDDDTLQHEHSHVDVSDEHEQFKALNHELINSRTTKTNKEAKAAELAKMADIQKKVSDKVDAHIKSKGLSPRWGSQAEGIVVHPVGEQPRFKVTSDAFRQFKKSDESKTLIKRPEPK